jgi:hypothetical protein
MHLCAGLAHQYKVGDKVRHTVKNTFMKRLLMWLRDPLHIPPRYTPEVFTVASVTTTSQEVVSCGVSLGSDGGHNA